MKTFRHTVKAYSAKSGDRFSIEILNIRSGNTSDYRKLHDLIANHAFIIETSLSFVGVLVEKDDRNVVLVRGIQDLSPESGTFGWVEKVRTLKAHLSAMNREERFHSKCRRELARLCGLG